MNEHDNQQALQSLTDAEKLLDNWLVHFDLGLVYLEAGAFAEADSEFDICIKRRGEVLELFMDDMPTYSYLPLVYYYQGRAREGLEEPWLRGLLSHLPQYPGESERGSRYFPKSGASHNKMCSGKNAGQRQKLT